MWRFLARLQLRVRPRPTTVLIGVGVVALVLGAIVTLVPWYEAAQFQASPEAARAQRNADAAQPIWLTPAPATTGASDVVAAAATARARAAARVDRPLPTPAAPLAATSNNNGAPQISASPATPEPEVQVELATPTLAPSDLELAASGFRFLDPPEPGARARLTVSIHNPTDRPGGPIDLLLPLDWLVGYRIESAAPRPSDGSLNGQRADGALRLTFDGPDAQSDVDLAIDVVTTDEVIDAPKLKVLDAESREVGDVVQPPTEAPPPRPGPIYSIDIPHLRLHAGVLPVDWEPPLFVVGQLRKSAFVTQGNSVLVGHVRGAPGYNVFDHLDQLSVGDKVIASSRGETYDFVVSQKQVLPEDDVTPTGETSTPRLTLMTCAGDWNPLTRDYPDRLWVIAEPPDAAAATIAARPVSKPAPTVGPTAVPTQISARGGLGNTDVDLAAAFGAPVGESSTGLAVYRKASGTATTSNSNNEPRAQLADFDQPSPPARRALLVAEVPPAEAPLTFDAAVSLSRSFAPKDTQPRAAGPEGNQRFVVERFTSPSLAATLPPEWFTDRQGQPGDFSVVYLRRPDGRIALVVIGIGDDAEGLLALFKDVRGASP